MQLDLFIHLPIVASALGFESPRAVKVLCQRHGFPVYKINGRQNAMKRSDYEALLSRMSGQEIAA